MTGTAAIASNRRWRIALRAPRFGLRGLLAGMTFCAVACGWLAHRQRQVLARRAAMEAVYAADGFATFEHRPCPRRDGRCGSFLPQQPPGPAWLRSILGDDFFARAGAVMLYECRGVDNLTRHWDSFREVYILDLGSSDITDRGMLNLPRLPRLIHLKLDGTSISDAGLARVNEFSQLTWLDLGQTNVSSAGLACLSGLTELSILNLAETRVTSPGLAHLCELPNLGNLNLSHTAVDDEGLALLGRMTEMVYLDLSSTRVTDGGMHYLGRMTQLVELNLSDTGVSGRGLGELGGLCDLNDLRFSPRDDAAIALLGTLPHLVKLHLSGAGVTDKSLAYVLRFTRLKSLTLERTSVSWLGLAFVRALGPDDFETDAFATELDALGEWLDSPLVAAAFDTLLTATPTLAVVDQMTKLLLADGRSDAGS